MNVLAWKQYGTVNVLAAETPKHFFKIHEELVRAMNGWGENTSLDQLFEEIGVAINREKCQWLFQKFVRPHIGQHETFESFDFTQVQNT